MPGTKATVEAYEDRIVVRGFCGVEGYDLVAYCEYGTYEYEGETYATYYVTELTQEINGQVQQPTIYGPYDYNGETYYVQYLYTGDPRYGVIAVNLSSDGTTPSSAEAWKDSEDCYLFFYAGLYDSEADDYTDAEIYNLEWPADPASIGAPAVTPTSNATYNLAGQHVDSSYKGIVIRNNKKILMK